MANNTESLVFDLLVRDQQATDGLGRVGRAASGAARDTDALTQRLNELSRKSVEARVRLAGDKEALASLDKMDARLISLDRRVASPNMKVEGAARAIAEISAVDLEMDKLGGRGGSAEVAAEALGPGGLSGASGMGAAIGAGVALAPVIATVGTGLAGLAVGAYGAISPIMKASQATGGLAANLRTLNPEQQLMARQLLTLQGEAAGFAKSLQPEVVKLWGDAMSLASGVLHDVQPVAKATGDALHVVLANLGADLHSAQWQSFFQWMAANAGPDVKLLGQNITDLVNVLPQLLMNLQPVAVELLQVTDAALKLTAQAERLQAATVHLGDSSQHSAGLLGIVGGAVKNAAVQMVPGLQALPLLKKGLDATTSSSGPAAGGMRAVAAAVVAAHPAVGTLAGDMTLLNSAVTSGNVALQAYSDLWDRFVGHAVSDQQAVLNVRQAFEAYDKAVKSSNRTSTAAQQAFLAIFTAVGSGLDTLRKNGAGVQTLNSYYQVNIDRLNRLHGLSPAQRADVAGLTKDYLAWASSVQGLSGNVVKAAGSIRNDLLTQLAVSHRLVPAAKADTDALAASILKTGANSRATVSDRQRLIQDLVHSGLSAQQAAALVKGFQDKINALKGKTVNVGVTASGSGGITVAAQGLAARIFKLEHLAAGGRVPGTGTGDTVPAMLTPGEVIVPVPLVRAGLVDHLRGRIPGFASGGVAGMVPYTAGQAGSIIGGWAGADTSAMMAAMIAQYRAAAARALAAAGSFTPGAPASGSAAAAQAFARSILPSGWSWPALLALWNRESGWNANAVNPSSGAYGIPQALGKGHPFNLGDYANQVRWGIGYIAGRYGSSQAAWAHEVSAGWYGDGLDAVISKPTLIGVGERGPEHVKVTPGGRGGGVTYVINVQVMPGGEAEAGRVIVQRIRAFERRSGKGWRS